MDQVHDPLQAPIKDSVEQDQRNISKSFSCSQCGKKFKQKIHLKTHEQIHTGKKPFTCSYCDFKCLLPNNLKQHERMHTGDKPYSCSICAKNFRQLAHLKRHERIHTGDKPFTCSDCDFKSNSKGNLDAHKRIHKGDKPFKPSHCSKKFTQKAHLTRHKSDHCPYKIFTGLSFIGWYKDGKPTGPCWRRLKGPTYLYGIVDDNGDFTGDDISFIYQDLETALVGKFDKGIMVRLFF